MSFTRGVGEIGAPEREGKGGKRASFSVFAKSCQAYFLPARSIEAGVLHLFFPEEKRGRKRTGKAKRFVSERGPSGR